MDEIFRSYMILFLNNTINSKEKIVLAKDALEISERLLKKHKDAEGSIPYNKILLLKEVAALYERGINNLDAFNKLFFNGSKWIEYQSDIRKIMETEYNELEIEEFKRNLICEKEYLSTEETLKKFKDYIDKVESRSFPNIMDMQTQLRNITENLYMDFIRESNLAQSLDGVTEIDFQDSDMLVNKMFDFFDGKNFVSTGFKNIDELFGGGFENTRLYVFAGRPGSGKSTFLLNFFYNLTENVLTRDEFKDRYVLYVTLENLGLETMQRLICKILHMPAKEYNSLMKARDKNFMSQCKKIIDDMHARGGRISYFPSRRLSPADLFSYVEKLNMKTGKKPLSIIVDYLDIMKLPTTFTELRHQLGDITLGLKSMAVQYKIPVITATQLTKNSYEGKPTLGSIKESSEKIDHADAIGLIQRLDSGTDIEEHINTYGYNVEVSFDKSRASGNGTLRFAMDPSKFDIQIEKDTKNSFPSIDMNGGNGAKRTNNVPSFASPASLINNMTAPKPIAKTTPKLPTNVTPIVSNVSTDEFDDFELS